MTDTLLPTMLIVDDDEIFRTRLGKAFERRGFDVRHAWDFASAEAAAEEESPELAVVDLRMKDSNGLDVLKRLLEIDASTRVVILTGYGSIATAVDAMRLGATNYVPKPADADDILAAFDRGELEPQTATSVEFEPPTLARMEWEHINRVLADCGGNISEAARRLGLHRRTLQRKLEKYPPQN